MVYSIVGADGKEYGPVDHNGLVQWAREGRIVASTVVVDHTSSRRFPAADLPELSAVFSPPATTTPYPIAYAPYGYGVKVGPDGRPLKSRLAAGLLGILVGAFGVHRFYLGYPAVGVVMLLLTVCTCGYGAAITGIWGLVEGILCLTGSMTDAQGRPLAD